MTTTAQAIPRQQTQAVRPLHPLLTVMAWEARRLRASRLTWLISLAAFALFLLVIGIDHGPSTFMTSYQSPNLSFAFSSNALYLSPAWLSDRLYRSALLLLLLALPFVCADGVALDLKRRTRQVPPAKAGGLWPDSTAVPRTWKGAQFWLRGLSHQGHSTTAPLPSSPAG